MLDCQFLWPNEGPDIIIHQLKSSHNPFKDLYSQPILTCLAMIASNEEGAFTHVTGPIIAITMQKMVHAITIVE